MSIVRCSPLSKFAENQLKSLPAQSVSGGCLGGGRNVQLHSPAKDLDLLNCSDDPSISGIVSSRGFLPLDTVKKCESRRIGRTVCQRRAG